MNDPAASLRRGFRRRCARAGVAVILGLAAPAWAQVPAPQPGSPIQIYFPPAAPVMGSALPAPAHVPPTPWPAPAALAPFVADPFYAPLSTRLAKGEVDSGLRYRLDSYQASKVALQTELHAKLDTLKDADADARRRSLEEFAREQTPRIAELEAAAEQLRQDLCRSRTSRNEYWRWMVDSAVASPPTDADLPARFSEVARMDQFYHEGLSPDQRRLLREAALEEAQPGGWFFFSPAPARIPLPSRLPPELAAKLAAYATEKSALKSELLATLHPHEKTTVDPTHAVELRTLAASQAPRFAELEGQAEEIRRGLAVLQDPAHPTELPATPSELADRIALHRRNTQALQQELLAKVAAVKQASPAGDPAVTEKIRQAIATFTRDNAERYAALEKSKDSIHADLAKLAGPGGASPVASADALQKTFSDSRRQLESFWNYRDYQTAVLQPGLSPEQRRLLFDGALVKLALPLPAAEIDPGRR